MNNVVVLLYIHHRFHRPTLVVDTKHTLTIPGDSLFPFCVLISLKLLLSFSTPLVPLLFFSVELREPDGLRNTVMIRPSSI